MSLHFTRADLSDATEISAILEEWYLANSWIPPVHDPVERADYGRVLLDHSQVTMLHWQGQCVGFLALERDIVQSLYIRSEFQRRGFGRTAMSYAQTQCDQLRLWVFQSDGGRRGFIAAWAFRWWRPVMGRIMITTCLI